MQAVVLLTLIRFVSSGMTRTCMFENTQVVALVSLMQLERNDTDVRVRKHFQKLYEELRSHLADAYDELDQIEYKMGPNNKHKLQVCVYNASFEP